MKLSFRHFYYRWTKNLLLLMLIFLALMSLARLVFVLYFGELTSLTKDPLLLLRAMWLGVRYDLMPIAYISALPFIFMNLAYLVPGKVTIKIARTLVVSLVFLGLMVLGWLYVCDYAFYSYFQDHINVLFFGLFEDDTVAVLTSIWKNYNVPVWMAVIFFTHFSFFRLVLFLFSQFDFDLGARKMDKRFPFIFLGGIVAIAFFARGNFSRLPLSIEDAHISSNEFINKLSLNGPICLNRTIKIRRTFGKGSFDYLRLFGYSEWQMAFNDAKGEAPMYPTLKESLLRKTPKNQALKEASPHVVMVVMESFGTYWNDQDSATFNVLGALKDHFRTGLYFKNFLPAENGTIGSIVSVATSSVIRPGARFLSESEFLSTALGSAGHLPYKESGYDTHFVYGGKLGWRDLGKYLAHQSYDRLWGADEIKSAMPELQQLPENELGNEWGIFDEYLYSFIEDQLRTASRPQFFLVLTTSNHPPFEYPISYRPLAFDLGRKIESLTLREDLAKKRFLGLQYSNQKMGEFLTRIRTTTATKNKTVVGLTGDHSFWIAKGVGLEDEFRRYAVPFLLSLPEGLTPKDPDLTAFGSHEDIFPTLYHLTLSDQKYIGIGENILGEKSIALNSTGLVADKSGAFHNNIYWKWRDLDKQILERSEATKELERLPRHRQGLISITDLYLKQEKEGVPVPDKRPGEGSGQQ
jgi:hypothetical protein